MNYFTHLIELLWKGPRIATVPPETPEGPAATSQNEPLLGPPAQGRP